MKAKPQPNDEALDRQLRAWVVDAPLPPGFQDQVWRRIARAGEKPAPAFWSRLSGLLEGLLSRPRVASAYIAVLLALGITAGLLAAQKENNRLDATLGSHYVQSVDPYRSPR